jgi:HEPN domain-containing protein
MNDEEARTCRVIYALELRELADKDYISARMNYKLGLLDQFLWAGLQAVEKYLKAILLLNDESTLGLSHRISKAYERVLSIKDNEFDFAEGLDKFIEYLNDYGNNRYWEFPTHASGFEHRDLDLAVWNIRRYCQPSDSTRAESRYEYLNSDDLKVNRYKLRISGGFLERVLDEERSSDRRKVLVWKNFCYGSRRKHRIKNYRVRARSASPIHFFRPECYPALKDYVQFPKSVRVELESHSTASQAT